MIKYIFVTINSIILFFYSMFFDGGAVSLSGNFPANMKPGTETTVDMVIKKGGMGGFAKLQVEVPAGFTIAEVESKGGTFSFANGMAKWIWTGVPSDPEFTVKFKLQADATASGEKAIGAKYSYIENNNKQVAEMPAVEIMVGDGTAAVAATPTTTSTEAKPVETPTVAAVTPTETKPVETPTVAATPAPTVATSSNAEPISPVSATRIITPGTTENDWNVNVTIKKPGIKGFARYSDNLPVGFNAKQGKTNGSSFSIADDKIKFVWVNVPTNDEVDISYTLVGSSATETFINGEFSYLENNQSKAYKMAQDKLEGPIAGNIKHTPTESVTPTETKPVETPTVAAVTPTETKPVETPTVAAVTPTETKPVETPTVAAVTPTETKPVENVNTSTQTNLENNTARKDGNVSYCVQIGAYTNNNVTASQLTGKYGFSETVRSEMAEGFNKFLIGKHEEYKPARDHRETARGKGVRGAFVAAYNGPKRITVQEALMLSNQKWYK